MPNRCPPVFGHFLHGHDLEVLGSEHHRELCEAFEEFWKKFRQTKWQPFWSLDWPKIDPKFAQNSTENRCWLNKFCDKTWQVSVTFAQSSQKWKIFTFLWKLSADFANFDHFQRFDLSKRAVFLGWNGKMVRFDWLFELENVILSEVGILAKFWTSFKVQILTATFLSVLGFSKA